MDCYIDGTMFIAIITAGGRGERVGGDVKKQFRLIAGKPLLNHTVDLFLHNPRIDCIVVVLPEGDIELFHFETVNDKPVLKTTGGLKRAQSVYNGLKAAEKYFDERNVPDDARVVLIHDGVRPFAGSRLINDIMDNALSSGAAVPVVPSSDTLIETGPMKTIESYPKREKYMSVQTPQGYKLRLIFEAYERAGSKAVDAGDESSLMHAAGYPIQLVEGERINIKITTAEDLKIAEALLSNGRA